MGNGGRAKLSDSLKVFFILLARSRTGSISFLLKNFNYYYTMTLHKEGAVWERAYVTTHRTSKKTWNS